jgi:hypothetical protein
MTKKGILLSALPTTLFIATMFVSSTFAWFTDFAINQGNRVQSGNLAIEFTASSSFSEGDLTGDLINLKTLETPLFNLPDPAQPGDSETYFLRVKSTGNIDVNYQIDFVVTDTSRLAEVIMFDLSRVFPAPATEVETVPGTSIEAKDLQNAAALSQNDFEIWSVTMRYSTTADNTYNDNTLDFEVDIALNVWQASNDAPQPVMVRTISELEAAVINEVSNIRLYNDLTSVDLDLTIPYLVTLDLGGFTLTVNSFSIVTNEFGATEVRDGTLSADTFAINTPNAYYNAINLTVNSTSSSINSL